MCTKVTLSIVSGRKNTSILEGTINRNQKSFMQLGVWVLLVISRYHNLWQSLYKVLLPEQSVNQNPACIRRVLLKSLANRHPAHNTLEPEWDKDQGIVAFI
jgi:hypothetical protein